MTWARYWTVMPAWMVLAAKRDEIALRTRIVVLQAIDRDEGRIKVRFAPTTLLEALFKPQVHDVEPDMERYSIRLPVESVTPL